MTKQTKRKLKESECITYEQLLKRNGHRNNLLNKGFRFIERTNKYKRIIAISLIIVGCLTLPLPTGSIILIGIGLAMLGIKKGFLKRKFKLYLYNRRAKKE